MTRLTCSFAPKTAVNESSRIPVIQLSSSGASSAGMGTEEITIVSGAPAPGSSVRVLVPAGPMVNAIVIPVSALRRGPSGDHVFVIATDASGKTRAHERQVRSGAMLGDEIVILDGLTAGEQVAASGSFKLRESVQVAVGSPKAGGAQ